MTCAAQLAPRVFTAVRRPGARPLVLSGRAGTGKTSLLRRVAREAAPGTVWCSAFEFATQMADAIREGRYESYRAALSADDRPLYVEHLEDLRGKPRTRVELRSLLDPGLTGSARPGARRGQESASQAPATMMAPVTGR